MLVGSSTQDSNKGKLSTSLTPNSPTYSSPPTMNPYTCGRGWYGGGDYPLSTRVPASTIWGPGWSFGIPCFSGSTGRRYHSRSESREVKGLTPFFSRWRWEGRLLETFFYVSFKGRFPRPRRRFWVWVLVKFILSFSHVLKNFVLFHLFRTEGERTDRTISQVLWNP